jgi:two-component system NarL family response regulator
MTVRLALADDHRLLRESLRNMLAAEEDLQVVAEASDGPGAVAVALREVPDVLVLDIRMPGVNGIEIARELRARNSPVRVLALTAYDDKRFVQEMLKAGAAGYVTKTAAAAELAEAIRRVARGESYLSSEIQRGLVADIAPRREGDPPPASCLGPREREVLRLLADGHRLADIARQLKISAATVETHRRNIATKLGLRTIAELTKYAVREGLTSL